MRRRRNLPNGYGQVHRQSYRKRHQVVQLLGIICDVEATTMTKKKVIYYYTQMGGLTVFFFLRPFTILYFIPRPLSPTYLRRPRTCSCTPGTDYPKSRRGGLYNMYIRFFFFLSVHLSLLLGPDPSLSIPICLSLFYRLL